MEGREKDLDVSHATENSPASGNPEPANCVERSLCLLASGTWTLGKAGEAEVGSVFQVGCTGGGT